MLQVTPIYDKNHSCMENVLCTLANWAKRDYVLMYAKAWDFNFKPVSARNSKVLGERVSGGLENSWESFMRYHGFKFEWHYKETASEQIVIIKQELEKEKPVIICMDGYWVPWASKLYQIQHTKHYFLAIGLDEKNQIINCIDSHIPNREEIRTLKICDFNNGNAKCISFSITDDYEAYIDWYEIINDAINTVLLPKEHGRNSFDDMRFFADEVESKMDLADELNYPSVIPLLYRLRLIGAERLKFGKVLSYLAERFEREFLFKMEETINSFGKRWLDLRKLYKDTSNLPSKEEQQRIVRESAKEIRSLASDEERFALMLLELINKYKYKAPPKKNISLPINIQQDILSYTKYALPLCIVFNEKKYLPWFYKRFIQIQSLKAFSEEGNQIRYKRNIGETNDYLGNFNEVLDIDFIPYNFEVKPSDFLNLAKEKLKKGKYVYIDIDEYYIPNKKYYQKKHFPHPSLLYGIDEYNEEFKAIGFVKSEKLETFNISFENIGNGIRGIIEEIPPKIDKAGIWKIGEYFLDLKPIKYTYQFTIQEFNEILKDFLSPYDNQKYVFGFGIYEVILNGIKEHNLIKYNTIHLLYEHKNTFLKAMEYIFKKNNLLESNREILLKYQKAINLFNDIRFYYLKDHFKSNNLKRMLSEKTDRQKLCSLIMHASEYEKSVLIELQDILNRHINV